MTDRRNATMLTRTVDPEWGFLHHALGLLYPEIEAASVVACVNIAVVNEDGSVSTYGVNRMEPDRLVSMLVTDVEALVGGVEQGMVQTSVDGGADG